MLLLHALHLKKEEGFSLAIARDFRFLIAGLWTAKNPTHQGVVDCVLKQIPQCVIIFSIAKSLNDAFDWVKVGGEGGILATGAHVNI